LDGVYSDANATNPMYVPSDMIHVYIQYNGNISQWNLAEESLFADTRIGSDHSNMSSGNSIYSANDTIYNVRLNEDKTYQISFGNDMNGMIPYKDSQIYVFYLDSNGPDGTINVGDISNKKI